MEQFLQQTLQSILLDGNINVAGLFVDYIDSWATPYATHYTNGLVETNLLRRGFIVILEAQKLKESRIKLGCVLLMVIWPAFRMGQYRVNDHPNHALLFIVID